MTPLILDEATNLAGNSWHLTSSFTRHRQSPLQYTGITLWHLTHGIDGDAPLETHRRKLADLLGSEHLCEQDVDNSVQLVWGFKTVNSEIPFIIELSDRGISVRLTYGAPAEHAVIVVAELRKILMGPVSNPGLDKYIRG